MVITITIMCCPSSPLLLILAWKRVESGREERAIYFSMVLLSANPFSGRTQGGTAARRLGELGAHVTDLFQEGVCLHQGTQKTAHVRSLGGM